MKIPGWLIEVRRNSSVRRLGKWIERNFKRLAHMVFRLFFKAPVPVDPAKLEHVRRILLIRPNFRIGNTLISAPFIFAVREKFPSARLDYLGADTTAVLLDNLPVDNVFMESRDFIVRPWAYVKLLWQLRQQKYDLAIQVGGGSFSDMISMCVLNARYRMGAGRWAEGVCNIMVDADNLQHEYDGPVVLARALGVSCKDRPVYVTSQTERDNAVLRLSGIGLSSGHKVIPFVAFFAGGHKDKRWPAECWETLMLKLQEACPGARILVLLGPEELSLGARMRSLPVFRRIAVLDPLPLREFAAVLEQASLVVTPDTGPMHLAVAVNVPAIAVLQSKISLRYAPRGEHDVSLFRPTIEQVLEAIQTHKSWPGICQNA